MPPRSCKRRVISSALHLNSPPVAQDAKQHQQFQAQITAVVDHFEQVIPRKPLAELFALSHGHSCCCLFAHSSSLSLLSLTHMSHRIYVCSCTCVSPYIRVQLRLCLTCAAQAISHRLKCPLAQALAVERASHEAAIVLKERREKEATSLRPSRAFVTGATGGGAHAAAGRAEAGV